jgi:hypothetical protein
MQHPVVAKQVFIDMGLPVDGKTYYPEGSLNATLIEQVLKREARWLTYNKAGVLAGYNAEDDLMLGTRLVLNHNGKVLDSDIFWVPFAGDQDTALHQLYTEGLEAVTNKSTETHAYLMQSMTKRGWTPAFDDAGNVVSLCRNHVADVTQINRRNI